MALKIALLLGIAGSIQADEFDDIVVPRIRTSARNVEVVLPVGKHLTVRVDGLAPITIDTMEARMAAQVNATTSTLGAALNGEISTATEGLSQALSTLDSRLTSTMEAGLSTLQSTLTARIDELDATKASLATQNELVVGLNAQRALVGELDERGRLMGQNLVHGDLRNTSTWQSPLPAANVQMATFTDGLPIRTMISRESSVAGSTCYDWGLTNIFKVDPHKTYEFSIYVRDTNAMSLMNNYFGFYIYTRDYPGSGDGTRYRLSPTSFYGRSYTNPYFKSSENDGSEWHKMHGFLIPSDFERTDLGYYAGFRRSSMFFAMPNETGHALLRFGSCYAEGNGNDAVMWTMPSVREIDLARNLMSDSIGNANVHATSDNNRIPGTVPIGRNLVRNSNLLNTARGAERTSKGGDRWTDPVSNSELELTLFDGAGPAMPIVAFRSQESGRGCYNWGHTNYVKVDRTRMYEFSIWIRSTSPDMNNYFGFNVYNSGYAQISRAFYGNPYFKCSDHDSPRWVQYKGYLVFDGQEGSLNSQCRKEDSESLAQYVMQGDVQYARLRFGSCYANGNNEGVTHFYQPSIRLMEGK